MHGFQADDGARFETLGLTTGSTTATNLTASASTHTKGAWSDIGTTTFDYEQIVVHLATATINTNYLFDIGIGDGAGNYWVLVENLRCVPKTSAEMTHSYWVPVHVPAGAVLAGRVQCGSASHVVRVGITGCSRGIGGAPGFSRCVALGANLATSRATDVDPGGTAHTEGAWAQLTASTAIDIAALFVIFGPANDTARIAAAGALCDIGVGAGGSEAVVVPNQCLWWGPTIDNALVVVSGMHPVQIPAGSRVAARAQCNINTAGDRTLDVVVYGLAA